MIEVGVLLRNLIYKVLRVDVSTKERGVTIMQTHLSMLVDAVRSCGVSFKVWRVKDENVPPVKVENMIGQL